MKRSFFAILFSPLFFSNSLAQWEILNEGFKGSINTIDFVNDNVGWIAGGNGTLLKTTDGGETWNDILINENWHINQIDFISEFTGYAIGKINWDTTAVWKTSDGGFSWAQYIFYVDFNSLYVIDENNVFVIGGIKIYKTSNGGLNWIDVSPNLLSRNYNSLWFLNSETGIIVGSYNNRGIILRTNDGGASWSESIVNEFNSMTDLQFLDSTAGYFRANLSTTNFLCKTEDMCLSWTIKTQHPYKMVSYKFLDSDTAYAIMGDSITSDIANNIMKSIDGGVSWQNLQSINVLSLSLDKIYVKISGVSFILTNFWAYDRGSRRMSGVVFKSINNDKWTLQKFDYPSINDVYFINGDKGFILCGYEFVHGARGHLFSSTDGGKTWSITYGLPDEFRSCLFINEFEGFFLTSWMGIYKTTDCGIDWDKVYESNIDSIGYDFYGNDICFKDEQIGWAVGGYSDSLKSGAGILGTTDNGDTWSLIKKFPDQSNWYNLNSIHLTDTTAWTVGENGMILKYTPQTGWVKQGSVTDLPLNKVFFTDDNHGWIAGGYLNIFDQAFQSILLKTTNGGENWETKKNLAYLINDLWFTNNQHGWAVGCDTASRGVILETKDGGVNWSITVDNLIGRLNSIFIKDNYAWAVGDDGLVLRTTNAGPTWVNENNKTLPTEFTLEQNYPNPFNPSTKISYAIPLLGGDERGGLVTLKVYDVLGREAATLVNEEKKPGEYEVEFDGGGLSSGIYLYRLTAGNHSLVRKMILMK